MPTVLVIDNSAEDRDQIRTILAPHGLEIVESDVLNPELSGLETADVLVIDPAVTRNADEEMIKKIKLKRPRLPVIVVSVKGNEELVIRALQNGAASYVPKLLLEQELLRTVRDVLNAAREHESKSRTLQRRRELTCQFELENDRKLISCVVDHLQQCCAEFGLFDEENELIRVGMALDEALANAMMHGNLEVSSSLRDKDGNDYEETSRQRADDPKYRNRRVRVSARFDKSSAEFVIQDDGPGFAHRDLENPTDDGNLERVSGRGVLLMRTFMDLVEFNAKGNCVTMRKAKASSPSKLTEH